MLSLGGLLLLTSCHLNIQFGKRPENKEETSKHSEKTSELYEETERATEEIPKETEVTEIPEDVTSKTTEETTQSRTNTEGTKESEEVLNLEETTEKPQRNLSVAEIMEMDAGTILSRSDLKGIDRDGLFTAESISDKVFDRMEGVSFGKDCTTKRKDLRYLRVLHRGFDGKTHIGEIVCNKAIAKDLLSIFRDLYHEDYPIEKILLVDEYGGDDELSMEDNNTSCFNFRPVTGKTHLSQHAYGRAIDINPLYNPYITSDGYQPYNAGDYVDRSAKNPYIIDKKDLCYRLFDERGFTWGGSWNSVKDYQHFQKEE